MKYREIRNVLSQYCWKNTYTQTIFSEYLPQAHQLLNVDYSNLSVSDREKIDQHILLFFKPYCIVERMKKWKIETLLERYKEFNSKISQASRQTTHRFKSDAEIRELRMIQTMGGREYYNLLFE